MISKVDIVDSSYIEHHLIGTKCQEQNRKIWWTLFLIIGAASLLYQIDLNQCVSINQNQYTVYWNVWCDL